MYKRGYQREIRFGALLVLLVFSSPVQADLAQDAELKEKILAEFYPYRRGGPPVEGITPGMTINKNNAQVAVAVLPPEILKVVQAGDLEITVQATTDVPLREEYIEATVAHAAQVTLGPDGTPLQYVAGLPFPLIDPTDPQAGLKIGWNLRYRERADIVQSWGTTSLLNSSGGVQRSTTSLYIRMYGMHSLTPNATLPSGSKMESCTKTTPSLCGPLISKGRSQWASVTVKILKKMTGGSMIPRRGVPARSSTIPTMRRRA